MARGPFYWNQIERLIECKFHEAAGFTPEEFQRLVPEPKKEGLLVVSETCLNIPFQSELLDVGEGFMLFDRCNLNDHHNLYPVQRGLLYWIYGVDDGRATLKLSHDAAIALFEKQGRRPCVTVEVLVAHSIDAAGSRIGENLMPGLCLADDKSSRKNPCPKLKIFMASRPHDNGFERWGAASCEA